MRNDDNTREVGAHLEEAVLAKVKELDSTARLTRGSGQGNEYSDISSSLFYIECKVRNTKDFTIKESVWNHLNFNLPLGTTKICFMVHQNINKKRLVTLDLEDFIEICKTGRKNE